MIEFTFKELMHMQASAMGWMAFFFAVLCGLVVWQAVLIREASKRTDALIDAVTKLVSVFTNAKGK